MSQRAAGLVVLLMLVLVQPAHGAGRMWSVASDADLTPYIEIMAQALLPAARPPREVHALGGAIRGGLTYIDDHKFVRLEVARASMRVTFRQERQRYIFESLPTLNVFGFAAQTRLRPRLHVLYGAAVMRAGTEVHGATSSLCFHAGWALPLVGQSARNMRHYRGRFLQIETVPLAGGLLTDLRAEGFYDHERPVVQVYGEVALRGGWDLLWGHGEAVLRLSASYLHQHSMYLMTHWRWVGPAWLGRIAPVVHVGYVVPLRPLRTHLAEQDQLILYDHHFEMSLGIRLLL
jgi:hypothetical protein